MIGVPVGITGGFSDLSSSWSTDLSFIQLMIFSSYNVALVVGAARIDLGGIASGPKHLVLSLLDQRTAAEVAQVDFICEMLQLTEARIFCFHYIQVSLTPKADN